MKLPSGVVTLLFTDIESSMHLWSADPNAMAASLELHDDLLAAEIESHGGYVFTRAGDSFSAAFAETSEAIAAAQRCQTRLASAAWPGPRLGVRMGIHVGSVQIRGDDYFGPTVNLAARVGGAGHGGQIIATSNVVAAARPTGSVTSLGTYAFKGSPDQFELHQIGLGEFPELRAQPARSQTLRFDEVEIEMNARILRVGGHVVSIEPQVLDVLIHLIANRDRLVPREELLDEIWGDQFVSLSALTTRIKQARQALGDDGRTQRYIRNERGRGYQFIGTVAEPPPVGARPAPANVTSTPGTTTIYGRADDRRRVDELVVSSAVTTIVGPGGVGKTTLVKSLIEEWAAAGRAAVFARLDGVRDGSGLIPALTTTLGLSGTVEDSAVLACAAWLRTTNSVLVLDNCEHLLPAVREFVVELNQAAPDVSILATSRQSLGLGTESVFRLRPFELPACATARDVADWPCLQLFESAARRSGGMEFVDDADWREVVELCRRLDGLPLAIELAASRLSTLGLRDLSMGLDDRLDWIRNREVDAEARQRSLRSTVEWSFRFLDEEAGRLVAVLALFPAGLRLVDIRGVVELLSVETNADEIVARLVDASVLALDTTNSEPRYTMLETIRQFGFERMGRDTSLHEIGRQRVIDHAMSIARQERDSWTGDRDPRERSLSTLRAEVPNLRAAREIMLERDDRAGAVHLAAGLCALTEEMCLAELWSWHVIERRDGDFDDETEAAALMLDAAAARNRGDIGACRELAAASAQLTDDRWIIGRAKHTEAMAAMFSGAMVDAGDLWLESDVEIGGCRGRLFAAMAAAFGGDIERAMTLLRGCDVREGSRVPVDLFTNVHLVRGEIARIADTGTAKVEFERAVAVAREHGLAFSMGIAQVPLVTILEAEGNVTAAAAGYRDLIDLFLRTGTWTQIWVTLRNAARLLSEHDPATALLICEAAAHDASAPALDEVAQLEGNELRDIARHRLGDDEFIRVERRALLAARADVARETFESLGRMV